MEFPEIDSWLKELDHTFNLSKNTIDSYRSDIKQLSLFLTEYKGHEISITNDISHLSKNEVRSWMLFRKNLGDTSKTISRGISALKSLMRYLIREKVIENSEIIRMKPPKIEKSLPRPLNISQISEIIDSVSDIKQTEWIAKRDKALLVLIYSVGLRISEALGLNRSAINKDTLNITILGKGGKVRIVPVIDSVKNIILDYLSSSKFPNSEALFVNNRGERLSPSSIQKLVMKSRTMLGLSDRVTPHALRHSCATHLLENTGRLREIQELLGHASISSTQIYAEVAKKYVLEVYDKCHPFSNKKIRTDGSD